MKHQILVYLFVIFSIFSCKNQQDERTEFDLLYQDNYEFSNKILNRNRSFYYFILEERPHQKIEALNQLDLSYQSIISDIDTAILTKDNDMEIIISEYNRILNAIPKIVDDKKDFLLSGFEPIKRSSNELNPNFMKLRLTMAMAYAFEYAGQALHMTGQELFEMNSYSSKTKDNGVKLSLTSNRALNKTYNRHIELDTIECNGKEIEIKYTYKDNFSFANIEFDSLEKGNYRIKGTFKYTKDGYDMVVPINEAFIVE